MNGVACLGTNLSLTFDCNGCGCSRGYGPFCERSTVVRIKIPLSVRFAELSGGGTSICTNVKVIPAFCDAVGTSRAATRNVSRGNRGSSKFLVSPEVSFNKCVPLGGVVLHVNVCKRCGVGYSKSVGVCGREVDETFINTGINLVF